MIKLLVKIVAIISVLMLTACGTTLRVAGGNQHHQGLIEVGYTQPTQQQGYAPRPQQQVQQNGGCAPGSRRIGTNPQGGAHCEWNSTRQAQLQPQRYGGYRQDNYPRQSSGCSAGYRNLTTGKWTPTC